MGVSKDTRNYASRAVNLNAFNSNFHSKLRGPMWYIIKLWLAASTNICGLNIIACLSKYVVYKGSV